MHTRQGGWSLVELAVVLAIVGVIGIALWRLLPLAPKVAAGDAATRDLAQAEQALVGYALAHGRLPAPVSHGGLDVLPVDALGLPGRMRLRYQVQTALTVNPGDLFSPLMPPAVGASPATPTQTGEINGLDFCLALANASGASLTGMQGVPTAFALMHGGVAGHDSLRTAAFALPGSANMGERRVLALGPGELASRLNCPERVARVRGATSAAYGAYDLARVADEYDRLRVFAVQIAEMNLKNAETAELFAGFDIAYGVLIEALAILQEAAGWPPDPVGIATGIASHVTATAQLAVAAYNLAAAVEDREDAEDDLAEANDMRTAAAVNLTRMRSLAAATLTQADSLDRQGLAP